MAGGDQRDLPEPPAETLHELYEHAPCGYLTTRADGVIVRINTTLLQILGQRRNSVLGRPMQSILAASSRLIYETDCVPKLALNGFLPEIPIDLAHADGGSHPVLATWRRVNDAHGHILGYRMVVVNAVERVAHERALLAGREQTRRQEATVRELNADMERRVEARTAELVQAQRMESLGQLTGGVAHDFNNLLTPILITLDVLRNRYLKDERALRMANSAFSAAERARLMIARLLAFARHQHLHAQAVSLKRMTEEMRDLIAQAVGKSVALDVNIAEDLPPARVDRNQLEVALLNLCANARDAMPDGGSLTIAGDDVMLRSGTNHLAAGRYVRLSVSDTGSGMDTATLLRAAEPFYSTKDVGKGAGLGLSMVHGLAAQSGGRLVLESTQGHGTTATIWLPIDPSADPIAEIASPEPLGFAHRALSILLVDDDDLVRVAASEMLADLGHTTVQASCGAEALEALRQHARFDLLVTDYSMPNMTGVELARIARMAHPELPVLLVTGYASIKDVSGSGLPRIDKPFGTHDLSRAIAEALSRGLVSAT